MFFDFLHVAHAFTCFYMFYHSLKVWVRAKGYSTHPSSQMVWSLPPSLHLRASPEAQPSMTCPPPWYSVKIDPCRVDCTLQVPHLHMKGSSRALGASVQWVSESWSHATDRSEVEREREREWLHVVNVCFTVDLYGCRAMLAREHHWRWKNWNGLGGCCWFDIVCSFCV